LGYIELEPEVLARLRSLDENAINHVAFYIDLLAERGPLRIILMTVWQKTKMRETGEVERAGRALRRCQDEQHTVDKEEP